VVHVLWRYLTLPVIAAAVTVIAFGVVASAFASPLIASSRDPFDAGASVVAWGAHGRCRSREVWSAICLGNAQLESRSLLELQGAPSLPGER
jgi:hypothetical protein